MEEWEEVWEPVVVLEEALAVVLEEQVDQEEGDLEEEEDQADQEEEEGQADQGDLEDPEQVNIAAEVIHHRK